MPVKDKQQTTGGSVQADVPMENEASSRALSPSSAYHTASPGTPVPQKSNEQKKPVGGGKFVCPFCFALYPGNKGLSQHLDEKHNTVAKTRVSISSNESSSVTASPIKCPMCDTRYTDLDALNDHVNTEHIDLVHERINSPVRSPSPKSKLKVPLGVTSPPRSRTPSPSNMQCPVCHREDFKDEDVLAIHIDRHFAETNKQQIKDNMRTGVYSEKPKPKTNGRPKTPSEFEDLQRKYGIDPEGTFQAQYERNLDRAVNNGAMNTTEYFEKKVALKYMSSTGVDSGESRTQGIIAKLAEFRPHAKNSAAETWLCTVCDHYGTTYGDRGWGCGYRNIQMLLSSLVTCDTYKRSVFGGRSDVPSVCKVQELIECAWAKGYDPQGKEQLGSKLVNTRKWIGATECVVMLSQFGVKCRLVDFHKPTSPDGCHPALFQWILEYYQQEMPFRPPLYLQHQGHSRTIVGIERVKKDGSYRLLIFDPSSSKKQMIPLLSDTLTNGIMGTLRRPLNSLKAEQYQVVAVLGMMTPYEQERSKVLRSVRIP